MENICPLIHVLTSSGLMSRSHSDFPVAPSGIPLQSTQWPVITSLRGGSQHVLASHSSPSNCVEPQKHIDSKHI